MPKEFCKRFDIETDLTEAKRRFVNRVCNKFFADRQRIQSIDWATVTAAIALHLGEPEYINIEPRCMFDALTGNNFFRALQALEVFAKATKDANFNEDILEILSMSEINIGIRWANGIFLPSGATELDNFLVNDSLKWLREKGFETVLAPFEKSLSHLLCARSKPELLSDVITDAYEALEAMAKIVTGKDAKLDAIQQEFIRKIKASDDYKRILKEYILYAHKFRHGASAPEKKPALSYAETESFVYLTGLFIRWVASRVLPLIPNKPAF